MSQPEYNGLMGLAVLIVIGIVFMLHVSFSAMQVKGMWEAMKVARLNGLTPAEWRRNAGRALLIDGGLAALLGLAYYGGTTWGGRSGGVVAAAVVLVALAMGVVAWVIKAAWVKSS